jgi:hypothetical protein
MSLDRSMAVLSAVDRLPFDDGDCLPYFVSCWKTRQSRLGLPFVRTFQIVWSGGAVQDWKRITMADLEMLPVGYRQRIPESYLDDFMHMNVILF